MIEIRPARESDAQTLADLGRATFVDAFSKDNRKEDVDLYVAQTFSKEKQLGEIRDPNRRIEISWVGDRAVGFLYLLKGKPDPAVTGKKPVELLRIYVDIRWHGKGVGAALMERAIRMAREEGFQTLWLGVWERNFKAQAFYKKYGFTAVGKHIFRVGNDDQVDLVMARKI